MALDKNVKMRFNEYLLLFKQLKNTHVLGHREHQYLYVLAQVFNAFAQGYEKITTPKNARLPSDPKQALGVLLAEPQMARALGTLSQSAPVKDFLVVIRKAITDFP
jgi:hypothetical protein